MEFEPAKEVVNRKARIYLKLLLNLYHRKENAKNSDIMEQIKTTKTEVSACLTDLIKQGYVKNIGGKKKQLTEMGAVVAEEYHRRYENAKVMTNLVYTNPADVDEYAEILALTQGDELFSIDTNKMLESPLSDIMKERLEFSGAELSQEVGKGIFKVNIQFLTIPDGKAKMRKIMRLIKETQKHTENMSSEHPSDISKGHPHAHGMVMPDEQFSDSDPLLCNNDIYAFVETYSMANSAFIRTPYVKIIEGKGRLCLHRKVIHEKTEDGMLMEGQARLVEFFNGEQFVECEFNGDNVDIPLDCFHFIKVNGAYRGKLIMRFACTVGERFMPISAALLEMVI